MQITKEFLIEKEACYAGLEWFMKQSETDLYKLIEKLIKENHEEWANWLIARGMDRQQQLQYAIACAELALPIFEKNYSNDKRHANKPRLAIEAAKTVLLDDSEENKEAAKEAALAAYYSVAFIADAFEVAAWAAAYAARAAAYYGTPDVADYVTWAAEASAESTTIRAAHQIDWKPILEIGINILKKKV